MCVCETRVWIRVVKNGKIWDIHVTSLSQVGTATAEKDLICMRAGHCANTCHRKLYLNSSHAAAPLSTLHRRLSSLCMRGSSDTLCLNCSIITAIVAHTDKAPLCISCTFLHSWSSLGGSYVVEWMDVPNVRHNQHNQSF